MEITHNELAKQFEVLSCLTLSLSLSLALLAAFVFCTELNSQSIHFLLNPFSFYSDNGHLRCRSILFAFTHTHSLSTSFILLIRIY